MSEENVMLALYHISAQFKPLVARHNARLLKVVVEFDGREITYNHDDTNLPPEPEVERVMPPFFPPGVQPPKLTTPSLPVSTAPKILAPSLPPLPPLPPKPATEICNQPAVTPNNKRILPVDGIQPLVDDDICPVGKKYPNTKLKDIPADYFLWLYDQEWLRTKAPRLWAYIVRHEDVLRSETQKKW